MINPIGKVKKRKSDPVTRHGGAWGETKSSYSALEGGEWSDSRPGRALPPGKTPQSRSRRIG
jgi:hypothetical protein